MGASFRVQGLSEIVLLGFTEGVFGVTAGLLGSGGAVGVECLVWVCRFTRTHQVALLVATTHIRY